jgi:hypothetical protein
MKNANQKIYDKLIREASGKLVLSLNKRYKCSTFQRFVDEKGIVCIEVPGFIVAVFNNMKPFSEMESQTFRLCDANTAIIKKLDKKNKLEQIHNML